MAVLPQHEPSRARWPEQPRLIHDHAERLRTEDGFEYAVQVFGSQRGDGFWAGWVEFDSGAELRRTATETTQATRRALEFWATGLDAVYLEGAFHRAGVVSKR